MLRARYNDRFGKQREKAVKPQSVAAVPDDPLTVPAQTHEPVGHRGDSGRIGVEVAEHEASGGFAADALTIELVFRWRPSLRATRYGCRPCAALYRTVDETLRTDGTSCERPEQRSIGGDQRHRQLLGKRDVLAVTRRAFGRRDQAKHSLTGYRELLAAE